MRQTTTRTYSVTLNFDGWKVDVDVAAEVQAARWKEPHGETLMEVENVIIETPDADIFAVVVEAWGEDFPDTPCPIVLASIAEQHDAIEEQIGDKFEWTF